MREVATVGQNRRDRRWPKPRRARHVWVLAEDWHYPPAPGLVLEWRRTRYRWSARVLFLTDPDSEQPTAVQCWLPAERLVPIVSDPNDGRPRRLT